MGGDGHVVAGKDTQTNPSLPESQSNICRADDRKDSCKLSYSPGDPVRYTYACVGLFVGPSPTCVFQTSVCVCACMCV